MSRILPRCLASSFVFTLMCSPPPWVQAAEPRTKLTVRHSDDPEELQTTVKVYNSSNVPSRDLTYGEAQAANIFQKAGIRVIWVAGLIARDVKNQANTEEWNPAHLHLRIWTRSMARPKIPETDALGFSVSQSDAVVLSDAIQNLAAIRFTDVAGLLGLAMAHEMGHLLLRSETHSTTGIMQSRWLSKDLRDGEEGLLVFTREQGQLMRNEVRRRLFDSALYRRNEPRCDRIP